MQRNDTLPRNGSGYRKNRRGKSRSKEQGHARPRPLEIADSWLREAPSAREFFIRLDQLCGIVRRSMDRRCNGEIPRVYVRSLNDADLHYLHNRLQERFAGDLAAVSQFVQKDDGMDRWLTAAEKAKDFFARLTILDREVNREVTLRRKFRRKSSLPSGREPKATDRRGVQGLRTSA